MSLIYSLLHPIEELFAEHCVNNINNVLTWQLFCFLLNNGEAFHHFRVLLCKIEEVLDAQMVKLRNVQVLQGLAKYLGAFA